MRWCRPMLMSRVPGGECGAACRACPVVSGPVGAVVVVDASVRLRVGVWAAVESGFGWGGASVVRR